MVARHEVVPRALDVAKAEDADATRLQEIILDQLGRVRKLEAIPVDAIDASRPVRSRVVRCRHVGRELQSVAQVLIDAETQRRVSRSAVSCEFPDLLPREGIEQVEEFVRRLALQRILGREGGNQAIVQEGRQQGRRASPASSREPGRG